MFFNKFIMIKKVKSINSIFESVKDYDLIVTSDAPLNTALNRNLSESFFGDFALTSKMVKGKFCEREFENLLLEDLEVVNLIFNNLDFNYSLKESFYYFNEIKQIFRYVCDRDKILEGNFLSVDCKKVYDFISQFSVKELVSYNSSYLSGKNTVVVGPEIFEDSDNGVLIGDEKIVNIFENQEGFSDLSCEKLYLFDSKNSVINKIVSMIDSSFCDNVAVVLDISSEYLPVLKSKLINKNIPINEMIFLKDSFRVREYLELLDLVFNRHNLKVIDVYAISDLFGYDISESKVNYNFNELVSIDSNCSDFNSFLDSVKDGTFGDLFNNFVKVNNSNFSLPVEFSEFLYKINFFNKKVSLSGLIDLKFYLENFDESISQERSGVLLVDCKNSAFINREVVFYVGFDSSWTKDILKKEYINYDNEFDLNLKKFEVLIQQGVERFYFSTKFENGEEVLPPFYFNSLIESDVNSFLDVFGDNNVIDVSCDSDLKLKNFGICVKDELVLEKEKYLRKTLSNSKLSSFSSCPKKIAYLKLDVGCDFEHFTKGNLIHSFAEVYVKNSEKICEIGVDSFAKVICSELKFISNKYRLGILQNEVKFALVSVMDFVDNLKLDLNLDFLNLGRDRTINSKNIFEKKFDLKVDCHNVEFGFDNSEIKLKGFIDLVVNLCEIVDYKTGKLKTAKDLIESSDFHNIISKCDFQAFCYFSQMRTFSDKNLVFKYFHPFTNVYNRLTANELDNDILVVNYIAMDFMDYFYSKDFYEWFLDGKNSPKYIQEIVKLLCDFDYFKDLNLKINDFCDFEHFKNKLFDSLLEKLVLLGIKYKTEKQQEKSADEVSKFLQFIFDFKISSVRSQKEVFYFKDDVDHFEKYVSRTLDSYNESISSSFEYAPVDGSDTCMACEFKAICLKKYDEHIALGKK